MRMSTAIGCEPAASSPVCVGWTESLRTSEWRDYVFEGFEQGVDDSLSSDQRAVDRLLLSIPRALFPRSAKQEEVTDG